MTISIRENTERQKERDNKENKVSYLDKWTKYVMEQMFSDQIEKI